MTTKREKTVRDGLPGFTLTELLTVIAIIGILTAIIIPVTGSVRASAKQAVCLNNLRQIGTAWHLYLGENKGVFPDFNTYGMYNWGGRASLWGGPATKDRPLYPYLPDMAGFQCPGDTGYTGSTTATSFHSQSGNSYAMANSGERGILRRGATGSKAAIPGIYALLQRPSKTILVFDQTVRNSEAGYKDRTPLVFWHPQNTSNVLMADGHVEAFQRSVLDAHVNPANPPGYTWGWSAWDAESE
ncbi:MAG: prepilin-type N-terminal cleavage/methylation domain-containing protein [Opitutaceae bacterium]|jgi:prepilin-type N-terminal cleavage/methylation domain-containing protein/prepilin-type processing-associated H-X9-DG protein